MFSVHYQGISVLGGGVRKDTAHLLKVKGGHLWEASSFSLSPQAR